MENRSEQKWYYVTLTIRPEYYGWDLKKQHSHFEKELMYVMRNQKDWEFVAEETKKGNLHFHGLVPTRCSSTLNRLKPLFGHMSIQRCRDANKIQTYYYKKFDETKKLLGTSPLCSPGTERYR